MAKKAKKAKVEEVNWISIEDPKMRGAMVNLMIIDILGKIEEEVFYEETTLKYKHYCFGLTRGNNAEMVARQIEFELNYLRFKVEETTKKFMGIPTGRYLTVSWDKRNALALIRNAVEERPNFIPKYLPLSELGLDK